jgi:2'-5' RNA ligase
VTGAPALESAILLPVPEAEALVGGWRAKYDESAQSGIPAHISLLYPFLPPDRITEGDVEQLGSLFGSVRRFRYVLKGVGRFPNVVYLAPDPDEPMRQMTERIWALYPETPPYGGAFDEVIPHVTVAHLDDEDVLDQAEAAVSTGLPIQSYAKEAWLMTQVVDRRWKVDHRFPLS